MSEDGLELFARCKGIRARLCFVCESDVLQKHLMPHSTDGFIGLKFLPI